MTSREFFYLVANMRDAQKRYLKSRDRQVFAATRRLETEVDREIQRVKEMTGE